MTLVVTATMRVVSTKKRTMIIILTTMAIITMMAVVVVAAAAAVQVVVVIILMRILVNCLGVAICIWLPSDQGHLKTTCTGVTTATKSRAVPTLGWQSS